MQSIDRENIFVAGEIIPETLAGIVEVEGQIWREIHAGLGRETKMAENTCTT
jgi:hypothetical protein